MNTNTFITRDFYCAGFLVASGIDLESHQRDQSVTTFAFTDDTQVQGLVKKYYGLSALVNPTAYGNALRNLKSIIHSTDTESRYNNVKQYTRTN